MYKKLSTRLALPLVQTAVDGMEAGAVVGGAFGAEGTLMANVGVVLHGPKKTELLNRTWNGMVAPRT